MTPSDKGRNDIRPGQHPFTSTGRVAGGDETYGVYGTKGYYKTFQPQFKGRPLRHTEMDFNIDLIGQVIKGYRIVGSSLEPDEIDLVNDLDKVLMFAERDMEDAEGNIVYEEDGITPKVEYVWELSSLGAISGTKGDTGSPGIQGAQGAQGKMGNNGAQGDNGLTGVKGEVGSTGAQGAAGTASSSAIVYKFAHDTVSPAATPIPPSNIVFFEFNGAFVLSYKDLFLTDNLFKFLGLLETGSLDITAVSQAGANIYNHYTITNGLVDFDIFSESQCVIIYASTFNGEPVFNPNPEATGDITYNGTIPSNGTTIANVFIEKWNYSTGGGQGDGAQGATGAQGSAGVAGAQGATGAQGSKGLQGAGAQGAQGTSGLSGVDGAQGVEGVKGEQGAQGLKGETDGAQGAQGADGAQGAQGFKGESGEGIGIPGAQGAQGSQGTSGLSGVDGAQGTNGIDGAQGADGINGNNGTNGAQGAKGDDGINGTDGAQGANGTDGAQGAEGTSGATSDKFLNLVVVPSSESLTGDLINFEDQFLVIPSDFIGLSLKGVTASYGTGIPLDETSVSVIFTDSVGDPTTVSTYMHASNQKIYTANMLYAISDTGTLHLLLNSIPTGAEGYTVTFKFGL